MLIHLKMALEIAQTLAQVDELARLFWGEVGEGKIADVDAERVTTQIAAARERLGAKAFAQVGVRLGAVTRFPRRQRQRVSPDRAASRARRRELGLVGALPHKLNIKFTEGERAVMTIVTAEVKAKGVCVLPLEAIAARAGVCVTLARNAIQFAAALAIVKIVERPRRGKPNLPNFVQIVSRELRIWIWRGGGGYRIVNPKDNNSLKQTKQTASTNGRVPETRTRQEEAKRRDVSPLRANDRGVKTPSDALKGSTAVR